MRPINLYAANPATGPFSDDKGASARQNGNPVNAVLKNDYTNSPQFGFPALLILYTLVVVILVEIEYTNIIHLMILVD